MNKALEKFNLHNFEEIIETLHKNLPHIPRSLRKNLAKIMPYIAIVWGVVFIVTGLLPTSLGIKTAFLVDLKQAFVLNGLLIRVASVLTGFILFFAFQPLKNKLQKGWDSLWFVSIFQVFFGLLFFKLSAFLFVFVVWYILFEIKQEYNTSL
jgi:membrane protease YdiL (CAAX protease family)